MEDKLILFSLYLLLLVLVPAVGQAASQNIERLPGIEPPMLQADFWISRIIGSTAGYYVATGN